jgi:hypothetical protein
MRRKPLARERKLTRFDSGADSKVWMEEDVKPNFYHSLENYSREFFISRA